MISLASAPDRLRWASVVAWMGVIFWLSSRSTLPQTPVRDHQSILGHLGAYAVLALLLAWALRTRDRPMRQVLALAWVAAVLYGITDEIHQSFVPNRHPDIFDIATDATGAALALLLYRFLPRPRRPSRPRSP